MAIIIKSDRDVKLFIRLIENQMERRLFSILNTPSPFSNETHVLSISISFESKEPCNLEDAGSSGVKIDKDLQIDFTIQAKDIVMI